MTDSFPLTAADLRKQAGLFSIYEQHLALEFDGLTGLEINELAFARLTKPDPLHLFGAGSDDSVLMLGTDQRDMLAPKLAKTLLSVPSKGLVLDIGSGDGQTIAYALTRRSLPLHLIPLDPVAACLDQYREMFDAHQQISIPRVINTTIDELVDAQTLDPGTLSERFDAVVSVHSVYFSSNPAGLLSVALDRLNPGGSLLIVFAEDLGRFTGAMTFAYLDHYGLDPTGEERRSQATLDRLIGLTDQPPTSSESHTALRERLGRDDFRVTEVLHQPTRVYAHDLRDMIALAFINRLPLVDAGHIERAIAYVSQRLQDNPEVFDLRVHLSGPRARMFSVAQPQLFIVVEKL